MAESTDLKINCDVDSDQFVSFGYWHSGFNIEIGDDLIVVTDNEKLKKLRDFINQYLDE